MTDAPARQPQIFKAIKIEKPYEATALTDGWLCIKYLDGGEESLSTFADVSKGDIIRFGHSTHTSPPASDEQMQISDIIKDLEQSLKFYKDRVNMLQCWQSSMRDPERKIVCDILANGFTLTTKEEVDNAAKDAREQEDTHILNEIDRILSEHPARIVNHLFIMELKDTLRAQQEERQ